MTRLAAVIGHADEADLLERCIRHHLDAGIDRIFVSLNVDDADSERVARAYEHTGRVRVARLATFAADPFHHFTAAKDQVVAWCDAQWILFVDSDEFWVSRTASIADASDLDDDADLVDVPMFQALPLRAADGTVRELALSDPASLPIVAQANADADMLRNDPELAPFTSWPTKVLVRPAFVAEVGRGAHQVASVIGTPRQRAASDLAIVHVPFTTRERFARKLRRVRIRLATYDDRFGPNQAWHWRRWLALEDAGEIDAEFERNTFREDRVPELVAAGVITTAARRFAAMRAA